jgi:hypothetical protein
MGPVTEAMIDVRPETKDPEPSALERKPIDAVLLMTIVRNVNY